MTLMELMKMLVETDDQMERMNLVEANKAMIEAAGQAPEGGEDFKAKYEELKKKYIDTFFGGDAAAAENGKCGDSEKDNKEDKTEKLTIDEVLKGGK
jgi:hypothetical protein